MDHSPEAVAERRIDKFITDRIDSTGNLVSGLGEYGLANQLWALAARRKEARQEKMRNS